jgi:hypothetical protein
MRSPARAALLVSALRLDPAPLDLFALLRVPAIVRYVTSPARSAQAWTRCRGAECSARRRGARARR